MRHPGYLALWWVPLLIGLAPAFGLSPMHRDLVDFFAPMRAFTAASISNGVVPWLNFANGCGEAWFANPETAVFYPPAWIHGLMSPAWAMALEIALHLSWLSLGVGLLARHLGAPPIGRTVAEAAAWSVGPVIFTAGVLNNLETLAWVPWMILAARMAGGRAVFLIAVTTACAWLGGEPQMWAMAVALTVLVARSRRSAIVGVALGALVVAIQIGPFVFWVLEGDRGPQAATWALRGAVTPGDWVGLLVPGLPQDPDRMIYAESLFVGPPLLVCGLLGLRRRKWLLAAAAGLCLMATLPEIGGGEVFLALTGGLVRYPSRFALMGLALLLPAIGEGVEDWLAGRGRWAAIVVALFALVLCAFGSHPLRWWVSGLPAALMVCSAAVPAWRGVRGTALAAGLCGSVVVAVPLLGLQPGGVHGGDVEIWPEAKDGGRIYTPAPAAETMRWFATGVEPRRLWPVGYLNLVDGLTLARTDSPVANGRLRNHLEIADGGPENRWWLDSLAAPWVILRDTAAIPHAMDPVRVRGGMRLLRNRQALPVVSLAVEPPDPNSSWRQAGRARNTTLEGNICRATLDVTQNGWGWISLAPVRGWRWSVDGAPIVLEQGPGTIQYFPVATGRHVLSGRYRPPGLVPAACVSLVAILAVALGLWRTRRHSAVIS